MVDHQVLIKYTEPSGLQCGALARLHARDWIGNLMNRREIFVAIVILEIINKCLAVILREAFQSSF